MSKRVAISGYYGFRNFGDELILSILTKYLLERDCDVTVFSSNPSYTKNTYNVKSVRNFNIRKVLQTLWNCDVLVSGGGSLFQDVTSIKSLLYYGFVLYMAQLFGKRTIIFAQGVGPLNSGISRFLVRHLFSRCDYVSVRDERSYELLQSWGIASELVSDPVYSLELKPVDKSDIFGVQLRSFPTMNVEFVANLARAVAQDLHGTVKVFSLQKSLDFEICQKFVDLLRTFAPEKKVELVEEDLVSELSGLDSLVSMRFHSLLVGLKSGVRCSGINYDIKVEQLCGKYSLPLINFTDGTSLILEKLSQGHEAHLPVTSIDLPL